MARAPKTPSRSLQLGLELHQQGRLDQAERHYWAVLAEEPDNFDALHLIGLVRFQQGRHAEALDNLRAALKLAPGAAAILANTGVVLAAMGRLGDALESFDKSLAIEPRNAEALNNRGNVLLLLGRYEEALASLENALAINAGSAEVLNNHGKALLNLKRPADALTSFDKAVAIAPKYAEAWHGRGNALLTLKRPAEALASFDKALALNPRLAPAFNNRGNALLDLKRPEEALASFDEALALKPDYAEALGNLGMAFAALRRHAEAVESYDRALALQPERAELHSNRGNALFDMERLTEALASYDKAIALQPDFAAAHKGRGITLAELNRPEEALASLDRAVAIAPDDGIALSWQLGAATRACRWPRVQEILGRILARQTWHQISPFTLLSCCDDPAVHLDCAQRSADEFRSAPAVNRSRSPRPAGKLRIGYLSADFRRHPVAVLITELFELHDRTRFEVFGLSTGVDDRSDLRARVVKAVDHFLDFRRMTDREVAERMAELQIDIAVDLMGHTSDCRLGVLARRPAPIQVAYLGYPGTTGADFIDYLIADPIVLPFEQQPFYTERIVHLPDSYLVNDSKRIVPASTPTRRDCGLPEDAFVFCCFNNNYKITREIFQVWMRLLAAVPGSVLWLAKDNADAERNLRRAAGELGVDSARLVFAERVPRYEDHLARHRQANLFLDTLPYNAHTTASDALWLGLPVLTCTGKSFASRVAASLLRAVGLPELVTHNLADYEALAMKLAADPARLEGYRRRLEEERRTCALFDTARFTRNIEAAYLEMWQIHERGERPRSFSVPG